MAMSRTWEEYKRELLKDPEVAREYEALRPDYELVSSIISFRLRRGLTQRELADRMGTTLSVVSRLEGGSANPSLSTLKRLAAALDARLVVRFE